MVLEYLLFGSCVFKFRRFKRRNPNDRPTSPVKMMDSEKAQLMDSEKAQLMDSEKAQLMDSEKAQLMDSEKAQLRESYCRLELS
jgi:hypothetical protein